MKKDFKPLSRYKIWLKEAAKHYEVSESAIVSGSRIPDVVIARQTFYWLCWRDSINLPSLSRHLGKDRSTVGATMNQSWKNRERNIENQIYEKITSKKDLPKKKTSTTSPVSRKCSNVAISGRLVFVSTPRG